MSNQIDKPKMDQQDFENIQRILASATDYQNENINWTLAIQTAGFAGLYAVHKDSHFYTAFLSILMIYISWNLYSAWEREHDLAEKSIFSLEQNGIAFPPISPEWKGETSKKRRALHRHSMYVWLLFLSISFISIISKYCSCLTLGLFRN